MSLQMLFLPLLLQSSPLHLPPPGITWSLHSEWGVTGVSVHTLRWENQVSSSSWVRALCPCFQALPTPPTHGGVVKQLELTTSAVAYWSSYLPEDQDVPTSVTDVGTSWSSGKYEDQLATSLNHKCNLFLKFQSAPRWTPHVKPPILYCKESLALHEVLNECTLKFQI